jgi:radical SAM protein with 4Fe4S-binding SPASM domain
MEGALYESIIRDAGNIGIERLDIRNFGEPLLDKNLENRIRFAKENGLKHVFFFTNAVLLDSDRYMSLERAGLDRAIVSIAPRREYDLTRPETCYEAIIKNLHGIKLSDKLKIEIHIVAPDSSEEEINDCADELRGLGFKSIQNVYIHNWGQGEVSRGRTDMRVPCRRVWNSLTVLSDGRVAQCCIDSEGEIILGDARDQSLADIFNSDKYILAREQQLTGKLPRICRDCTNFR